MPVYCSTITKSVLFCSVCFKKNRLKLIDPFSMHFVLSVYVCVWHNKYSFLSYDLLSLNWFKFNENWFLFFLFSTIAWSVCDQQVFFSLIDWIVLKIILQISSRNLIVMCILSECVCFMFVSIFRFNSSDLSLCVALCFCVDFKQLFLLCSRVLHDFF